MRSLSWKLRQCGVHGHFILATSAAWLLYGLHWEQHVDGAAVARLALGGSSAPALGALRPYSPRGLRGSLLSLWPPGLQLLDWAGVEKHCVWSRRRLGSGSPCR